MPNLDPLFPDAMTQLLRILMQGPGDDEFFILDNAQAGLLPSLRRLSAAQASQRPFPDGHSIAGQVHHLAFTFDVFNRWAQGEDNPFSTADWGSSWGSQEVDDVQWNEALSRVEQQATAWGDALKQPREWDPISLPGAITSVAHLAYHLGAIRQILARDFPAASAK